MTCRIFAKRNSSPVTMDKTKPISPALPRFCVVDQICRLEGATGAGVPFMKNPLFFENGWQRLFDRYLLLFKDSERLKVRFPYIYEMDRAICRLKIARKRLQRSLN